MSYYLPIWKEAPFIRLLIPFSAGILLQSQYPVPDKALWLTIFFTVFIAFLFHFTPLFIRFKFYWITGLPVNIGLAALGSLITFYADLENNTDCISRKYHNNAVVNVKLEEPLSEKQKTFKATASARYQLSADSLISLKGNIILYFKKDTAFEKPMYGSTLILKKPLQRIESSGNPAAFDYKKYSAFHQTYYQVYLEPGDYMLLPQKQKSFLKSRIFQLRQKVIDILSKYIPSEKERGFAEALLIGYKNDLDRNLVQSYSDTGVVHVIAISGLHLGIIYWLLYLLVKPLSKNNGALWLSPVIIITGLWIFSLLAGAGPSVLRSAFMFSLIVLGKSISKNSSIYNNLAASAFILLCINPYWLWDAGFQLSYAAVLSIAAFFRPIYNWCYYRNKILDNTWKLIAVTLAAQILTVPISMYHFHQFPVYFLIANLVAVPLSGVILTGEIFLCGIYFFEPLAALTGNCLLWIIKLLNRFIENIDQLPFSTWSHLQISLLQFIMLMAGITGSWIWLLEKKKRGFVIMLASTLFFVVLRSVSFYTAKQQAKLIVYNIPHKQAIDFIKGRNYLFKGDPHLQADAFLRNFHLEPARTLYRIGETTQIPNLQADNDLYYFNGKKILIVDEELQIKPEYNLPVDILILSGNPKINLSSLFKGIHPAYVIADASNSAWKINSWKKDCDSAHIAFHNVSIQGAFVMDL